MEIKCKMEWNWNENGMEWNDYGTYMEWLLKDNETVTEWK
jgi:hypothetical protein